MVSRGMARGDLQGDCNGSMELAFKPTTFRSGLRPGAGKALACMAPN